MTIFYHVGAWNGPRTQFAYYALVLNYRTGIGELLVPGKPQA